MSSALDRLRASLPDQVAPLLERWKAGLRGRSGGASGGRSVGPIGVELGSDAVHFAQVEVGSAGVRLRASVSEPFVCEREELLADTRKLGSLVKRALSRSGFSGRRAVGCLHPPDVKLMVLDYSAAAGASEPQAIVRLVAERVNEAPTDLVIDYLPIRALGEAREQRSALVAVARRAPLIAHLETLRHAGLAIDALEIAPVAIRRLVGPLVGPGHNVENALVLFAGRERGHLSVLWGRRLVLYRELDFGEASAVERVAKALDLPPADAAALLHEHGVQPPGEAGGPSSSEIGAATLDILKSSFYGLAEQIDRARVYTASKAHGASPDRAYLLGAFAGWPRSDQLLGSLAGVPARSLDPLRDLPASRGTAGVPDFAPIASVPEMTLAIGLAMRGVVDDG